MGKKKKRLDIKQIAPDRDTIVIDNPWEEAGAPETPEAPEIANAPEIHEVPEASEIAGAPETPEAPETANAPETPEVPEAPETAGASRPIPRFANRKLYALLSILAPVLGCACGIVGAVAIGVGSLTDITSSSYTAEEIEEMLDYFWVAEFLDEHIQAAFISKAGIIAIILGILAIIAVIMLSIMTGSFNRDENGRPVLNWFDRLWSEIHIAAGACAAVAAVFIARPIVEIIRADNMFGLVNLTRVFKPMTVDEYYYSLSNDSVFWYCAAGMTICLAILVINWLSLVKKAKSARLLHNSLCGKLLKILGAGIAAAGRGLAAAGKHLGIAGGRAAGRIGRSHRRLVVPADTDRLAMFRLIARYTIITIGLIILPDIAFFISYNYYDLFLWSLISCVLAVILLCRKVYKLAEIRAGVIEVKSGNLTHKITVNTDAHGPKSDLDKLASDINHISEATNAAVQNEIRNQRLKTDLISNVSHDLKTPLTSMISYLDIIEKEGLDSPDAPAHLKIVREKTDRLKILTEDLFEAAKASSGNIPCEITDIDLNALIDQSLAEMGDRLAGRELEVRKNIRVRNPMVRADGKLLYRVLENLLGNISKYALEKSRVYIDVSQLGGSGVGSRSESGVGSRSGSGAGSRGSVSMSDAPKSAFGKSDAPRSSRGRILLEIKNISRDELNISPDELMERFTRGDESRNTEGSGLGLAIAKDLTTLMGGVFEISIDGDMFKASIILNAA